MLSSANDSAQYLSKLQAEDTLQAVIMTVCLALQFLHFWLAGLICVTPAAIWVVESQLDHSIVALLESCLRACSIERVL